MSALFIGVFNQKGGCGKTTTSVQLAGTLALRGIRTLLGDLDKQGTASVWSASAGVENPFPATVVSLAAMGKNMVGEIQKLAPDYDVILIDCPPAIDSPIPWATLLIADLGIIPVIPVMDNVWATEKAKELAVNALAHNPTLKTYFLISKMGRGQVYEACLAELQEQNPEIPVLKSRISSRNAYPESQIFGSTVHGLPKKTGGQAVIEVEALADEVLEILKFKKVKKNG